MARYDRRMSTTLLSRDDYMRLHEVRYLIRQFLRFSEAAGRAAGIEPQQHQLLLAIKAKGGADEGVPITVVAERLQIGHNSAVELVNRAEANGLVVRGPSAEDRRQVLVRLTPDGDKVLAALTEDHLTELRSLAPELSRALLAVAHMTDTNQEGTVSS